MYIHHKKLKNIHLLITLFIAGILLLFTYNSLLKINIKDINN